MDILKELAAKEINRRDFTKLCAAVAAVFGMPKAFSKDIAFAAENAMKKPAVIWLEGQDCAGCSESLLASINPSVAEIVLDTLSIRYHETIMAASGHVAEKAREDTIKEGGYVLVVEGSIPTADDRFCMIAEKPFREILLETAKNAAVIIAVGSCATFNGGIPGATPSKGRGVMHFIKDKPVINLPTCPLKPSRLVATVMYFLASGKAPEMDKYGRPLAFYSTLLHENCPRRGHFERGEYVTDWNDPGQREYCLLLKGCKGPKTYTDCAQVWWNDGANFCINAGAPCSGCSQPEFYNVFSPLYEKQQTFNIGPNTTVNLDTVGRTMIGVAGTGAIVHGLGRLASKNKSDEE
ncbi:MAG TPA: Ni,Fe-hydrogenase small subunit [Actinobacteria bacterium]|nr:Ni,Fe-hydrogenase small subunit [Actinomycetota bacterium]